MSINRLNAQYTRVSTKEQAFDSNALIQQRDLLKQFNCTLKFEDIESGRNNDRSDFNSLLKAIKEFKINTLYIRDMTRISRDGLVSLKLIELLKKTDTKLFVVWSGGYIDLEDPDDNYRISNEGLLAEREAAILSKRIKRGYQANRERNAPNARAPFGYKRSDTGYSFDDSIFFDSMNKVEYARKIIKLVLDLGSFRRAHIELTQLYSVKVPVQIHEWIRNPVLRGHTGYNRCRKTRRYLDIRYNTHKDIILSESQLKLIESRCYRNKFIGVRSDKAKLFSSRCVCLKCGSRMEALFRHDGEEIIRCAKRAKNRSCDQQSMTSDKVWQVVIQCLVSKANEFVTKSIDIEYSNPLNKELDGINNKIAQYKSINDDGNLNDKISELIVKRNNILNCQSVNNSNLLDTQQKLVKFIHPEYFNILTKSEKQQILDYFVTIIEIKDTNIEVTLRI